MTCEQVRTVLEEQLWSEVQADVRQLVRTHCDTCQTCGGLLHQTLALDSLLTLEAPVGPVSARPVRRNAKVWIKAAGWAAMLLLAGFVGQGSALRRYGPTPAFALDEGSLLNAANMGFESAALGWALSTENFETGGAMASDGNAPLVEVDKSEAHSGRRSLKLGLTSPGGAAKRRFPLPVPEGTLVRMVCWVKTPFPGSRKTKHLSLGVSGSGRSGPESVLTALDVFEASPHWRPIVLWANTTSDLTGLSVSFATGAGKGEGPRQGQAVWIDDVSLEVVLPARVLSWRQEGRRFEVAFDLPKGYSARSLDLESLRLVGANLSVPWVSGRLTKPGVATFDLVEKDARGVKFPLSLRFRMTTPDPSARGILSVVAAGEVPPR